jgi:hypothetical protein
MKQDELRQILKPLIKQCIKEVIFEDGVLSGIITEIVKGLDARTMIVESSAPRATEVEVSQPRETAQRRAALEENRREHRQQMEQQRQSLTESIGGRLNGINVFEGVDALKKAGNPSGGVTAPSSPLEGISPSDPGVDITKLGIFGKGR